jgi:hypothetical protein
MTIKGNMTKLIDHLLDAIDHVCINANSTLRNNPLRLASADGKLLA